MAFDQPGFKPSSFKAANTLAAKQFYFVEITAADTVDACNAATDHPIGIVNNAPLAGETCEIVSSGISKVKLGGTVMVGAWIGTHTDGTAVAKTTDKDFAAGRALAGGDAGDIIPMFFCPCFLGV